MGTEAWGLGLGAWVGARCYTFLVRARPSRQRRSVPAHTPPSPPRSAAARLAEAERLYREFAELTPFPYPKAFARSFETWADYERWRRAQTNPWLR